MTTLAISAVLAVALSISSTNGYHYVEIPTNMASRLSGVGMGAEVPEGDTPLRYEDVAFLNEAYRERQCAFSMTGNVYSTFTRHDERLRSKNINGAPDPNPKVPRHVFRIPATENGFFVRPEAELFDGDIKEIATTNSILYLTDLWCALFNETNSLPAITTNDIPESSRVETGSPLRKSDIAELYGTLGKMTRVGLSTTSDPVTYGGTLWSHSYFIRTTKSYKRTNLIEEYDARNDAFVYGEDYDDTKDTSYEGTFQPYYSIALTARNRKSIGYKNNKPVTDIEPSYSTETTVDFKCGNPPVLRGERPAFATLGSRKVRLVAAYAYCTLRKNILRQKLSCGYVDWTDRYCNETHHLLVKLSNVYDMVASSGIVFEVPFNQEGLEDILARVRQAVGGEDYASADALLATLEEADAPPDWYSSAGAMSYSDYRKSMGLYLNVQEYLFVLDVDFNARVKE